MRHHKKGRIFGRVKKGRVALKRSLMNSLIKTEAIKTTEAKAKEVRPALEKLVTKSRLDSPATRSILYSRLASAASVHKLLKTIGPKYKDRAGGYLRITKLGRRLSDGSPMAKIEFV